MFNEVLLVGKVTAAPVKTVTKREKKLAAFLQVDTYDAARSSFTHHVNDVICYGSIAQRALAHLNVGDLVFVMGYLSSYKVSEEGREVYRSVAITRKLFLLKKGDTQDFMDLSEINAFEDEDVLMDLGALKRLHTKAFYENKKEIEE